MIYCIGYCFSFSTFFAIERMCFFFPVSALGIIFFNIIHVSSDWAILWHFLSYIMLVVSFGSLDTFFNNDSEVLGIVRSRLLVCISVSLRLCPIFVLYFIILFIRSILPKFASVCQCQSTYQCFRLYI